MGVNSAWNWVQSNVSTLKMSVCSQGADRDKFWWIACGVQQWGYSSSGRSVTFPIKFPYFIFAALGTPDTDYTSATATGVHTLTLSNMGYVMHGSKGWWIAVGKQQWGNNASAGTNTSVTFPIRFPSVTYIVIGNMSKSTDYGYEVNIYPKHTWSVSSFTMYTRNTDSSEFTWIAFGKQQWGRGMAGTYNSLKTVTLPVAYSNQNYSLVASVGHASSDSGNYTRTVYMSSISTTSFKWASCFNQNSPTSFECGWITVGIQQWGQVTTSSGSNGYYIYTFPITFNVPCSVTLGNYGTANTDYSAAYSDLNTTSVRLADNSSVVQFMVIGY